MGFFSGDSPKDLLARRETAERLLREGKNDDAVDAYKELIRALVAEGLRLRAAQACRILLVLKPDDIEGRETLRALSSGSGSGTRNPDDDITLELQPTDVLSEVAPPPLPADHDEDVEALLVAGRAKIMRATRLFRELPDDVVDGAAAAIEHRVFKQDELLMRAGRLCDGIFAIDDGAVEVTGSIAPGGVHARIVRSGYAIGEMSALPENPATSNVVALTSTTAWFLSTQAIEAVAKKKPALRARIDLLSVCRRAFHDRLRPDYPTYLGV